MKMTQKVIRKMLSLLLAFAMVFSGMHLPVRAATVTTTWQKVAINEITSDDKIAITMTKDGTTYLLPTADATGAIPKAQAVTASNDIITIEDVVDTYGWSVIAKEDGGYSFKTPKGSYLSAINNNSGTRINSTEAVWFIDDTGNYLHTTTTSTSATTERYLGVYTTTPDWRTYANTTGNTAGQTLGFYKCVGSVEEEDDPNDITKLTPTAAYDGTLAAGSTVNLQVGTLSDVTYYVSLNGAEYEAIEGATYTIPKANGGINTVLIKATDSEGNESQVLTLTYEGVKEAYSYTATKVEELKDGQWVYIANGNNVLTSEANGKKLKGETGTFADNVLVTTSSMQLVKVSIDEETNYVTFTTPEGLYLTSGETGNSVTFAAKPTEEGATDYSLWTVTRTLVGETVGYTITNVNAAYSGKAQGLEYYNGFTTYGVKDTPTAVYLMDLYEADVTPIIEARATAVNETVTVTGTVTYVSGKNVYVQDSTGGICIFLSVAPTDINIGDVVEATGTRATYNGLEEVTTSAYAIKGTAASVDSKEVTISKLNNDTTGVYECTKVYLQNVVLGTINAGGNTPITYTNEDGTVDTINVYKSSAFADRKEGDTISLYGVVGDYKGYQLYVLSAADVTLIKEAGETPVDPTDPTDPTDPVTGIQDGTYVIWAPAYNKALSSVYSGNYNSGVSVTLTDGELSGYANTEIWTVTNNDDYTITISQGAHKLSMDTSYSSMPLDKTNDKWEVTTNEDGTYYIKNVGRSAYIEWYSNNSYWSGYGKIASGSEGMFKLQFTPAAQVVAVNSELEETIAAFGGGGPYETGITSIQGDIFEVGDRKSTDDVFTAVVSGTAVQPFTSGTSTTTGSTSYYMGGTGLGSGTNDYMQIATSSKGYGDMTLSFRLRASNTGSGEWQVQYSTDGTNFTNFTKGEYTCSFTAYSKDEAGNQISTPTTLTGTITDGIAKTSIKAATYVNFTFDVPREADDATTLYIRLVPSTTVNAKGSGAPASGGTVRIDSVKLIGSPVVADTITSYVVVDPDGIEEDQAPGTPISMTTSTEGAKIYYRFAYTGNEEWLEYDAANQPVLPETLPTYLQVKATKDGLTDSIIRTFKFAAGTVSAVKISPNGGGIYIENEEDKVSITLDCDTEGATIYYSTDGGSTYNVYDPETTVIEVAKGFGTYTISAYAEKDGFNTSSVSTRKFIERSQETYNIYFGQMHSHTGYSDGAGSADTAYDHADDVKNLDFLAVTDHSNSFDNAASGVISQDASAYSEEWKEGKELAKKYTTDTFVGLFGYEMTWSNGLGHINTFNTPGFQSRTQADYSTYSTALQNYYTALKTVSDSISQFNHPGTTFGDFSDFGYYDEQLDELITLVEVGNGEGAIGSSSYFPSYEYYTRALDKGWHVAPTNNQDNHKGLWGDANTARSVVLADTLDEDSIYDAMRNYRVYATEDNDLSVYYTLNDNIMGSILTKDDVGDTLTLKVKLADPTDSIIGKVEVIVNGGLSISSKEVNTNDETISFSVPSSYSYYYIKVTENDGDIAVTAPVWVGSVEAVGISSLSTNTKLAVQGESLDLNLELYNNEKTALEVTKVEMTVTDSSDVTTPIFTLEGEELAASTIAKVAKTSTASYTTYYAYNGLGNAIYEVKVTGTLNGVEKVYTEKLTLNYVTPSMVSNIVVDGTHYNDYVTGYYGGNMSNLASLASDEAVRLTIAGGDKSADNRSLTQEEWTTLLSDCSLLIVSAPARASGTANAGAYTASQFEDWFIELVAQYVANGGSLVVSGLADYQDTKGASAENHAAYQLNKLLTAVGSTMKINDDEVIDAEHNGGQPYRLYPENFNQDSIWLSGVISSKDNATDYQKYSQYSGCSVSVGNGTALVTGFDTTWGADSDKDGVGTTGESYSYEYSSKTYTYDATTAKGDVTFLAVEDTTAGGHIFVSGGVFVSDFEVSYELDNIYDLPYANTTIAKNIINAVKVELPYSTIAEVRTAANANETGSVYRVKGLVTAARNIAQNAFFDCIYIQDDTAGIDIFPISDDTIKLGDEIEITGYIDSYQGDLELKVMSYKILNNNTGTTVEPTLLTCAQASDYTNYGGLLTKVEGTVKAGSIYYNEDGTLAQFVVEDGTGETTIFIDGYIKSATTNENTLASQVVAGAKVSAVGVQYMHPEVLVPGVTGNVSVLRVRNCDEIIATPVSNAVTFNSVSLILSGQIGLNFYVTLQDEAKTDDAYMEFKMNGKTVTVPLKDAQIDAKGRYKFTMPVSSIEMADTVQATFHYGDQTSKTVEFSVKNYIDRVIENADVYGEKVVELCKAISDYGYYAQQYFSKAKNWEIGVAHQAMTKYQDVATTANLDAYQPVINENTTGLKVASFKLDLDSETTMKVYISKGTYSGTPEFKVNGQVVEATYDETADRYCVTISSISAHLLATPYTISVDGQDLATLSALSYAYLVVNSETESTEMKQLCVALNNYYEANMAYRG